MLTRRWSTGASTSIKSTTALNAAARGYRPYTSTKTTAPTPAADQRARQLRLCPERTDRSMASTTASTRYRRLRRMV